MLETFKSVCHVSLLATLSLFCWNWKTSDIFPKIAHGTKFSLLTSISMFHPCGETG